MSPFFGIEVAPGEPAYFRPDDELRTVHLRRATLVALDDDAPAEPARVVVKCRVDRGARTVFAPPHALPPPRCPPPREFADLVRPASRRPTVRASLADPEPRRVRAS